MYVSLSRLDEPGGEKQETCVVCQQSHASEGEADQMRRQPTQIGVLGARAVNKTDTHRHTLDCYLIYSDSRSLRLRGSAFLGISLALTFR
jgi:hypothetical protein